MCASIDMDGISRHIKTWNWVVIEMAVGFEDIPVELTDSVTTLPFVDGSEFKRTMNECVRVSKVDIVAKREEFMASSIGFGRVGRAEQMSVC